MILAFTGHRPDKLGGFAIPNPIYQKLIHDLHDQIAILKPTKAISGMALGVDQWAAEIVLDLGIPLIAAVPCKGQESRWPLESKKKYEALMAKASEVVYVSEHYHNGVMQKRNEWMVDHCDRLLAVFNWTKGGTANCIHYAQSVHKPITHILPPEH